MEVLIKLNFKLTMTERNEEVKFRKNISNILERMNQKET